MRIRIIRSQFKYYANELKASSKANIVFLIVFILFYLYCLKIGKTTGQYTNGECYMAISFVSLYILVRIIISGFNLPNTTYQDLENDFYKLNNSVIDIDKERIFAARTIIKGLMSGLINAITLYFIMSALNLVIDWRNYILISLFIVFGTFHVMTYGFIICALIRKFKLKKEIVAIFEILFLWLCIYIKNDYYFFPITIFKTQLEGIFMNDILYSKFQISEILSYMPLWIMLLILFVLVNKVINYVIAISEIEGKYEK